MRAAQVPHRPRATKARRHILLASASLVSLMAGTSAQAADILRSNVTAAPITASAASQAAAQQAALAAQRAQETLTRTTQALQAMQAAQSAAHAMALSVASSIPNGLGAGGLQVVANPVAAAQDSTGLNTWQGADAPTQANDASGHANVTIKQHDSRAILSWQSFNVGKDTTLTYDQQGNADWVALNRVVGADASPSQILGNIKADGTVLILNQNGIVFGGSSQINVNSLIATSLDVGTGGVAAAGNTNFLSNGILSTAGVGSLSAVQATDPSKSIPAGAIAVEDGAQIASGANGYLLLAAPQVSNYGHLAAPDGQVILSAGNSIQITPSTGASSDIDPNLRGLLVKVQGGTASDFVLNGVTGLIESPRGSVQLVSPNAVENMGGIFATTSISRNGAIEISSTNIEIAPNSIIAIMPDEDGETIPQDPASISDFKQSTILIANLANRPGDQRSSLVDIGSSALIYAPSGNISIGTTPGEQASADTSANSRLFVDTGAIIDASGLKGVLIPASRNQIKISPLKNNELAESPDYKNSFLNGATVYVDPRLSGVRDDGVAWIGSPLIDAGSYYQQVGVTVSELMTKGGNVTLGAASYAGGNSAANAPNVTIKAGATVDISGGWVTYQAGKVQTTQLMTSDGRVVDIGSASLDDTYVGIYGGFSVGHSRWGVTETYASPLASNIHDAPSYTEGRDAGSLTIKSSAASLDATVYSQAFPGIRQTLDAKTGTAQSSIYGDARALQSAPSQLPSGGLLFVQAHSVDASRPAGDSGVPYTGGADVEIASAADYQPLPQSTSYGQTLQVTDGVVNIPTRSTDSFLSQEQLQTIRLSDGLLSGGVFSQVSITTSGAVTVDKGATVSLAPGGEFDILAGRRILVDGSVTAPGGKISLATFNGAGSVFSSIPASVGDFDVVVNGSLSTQGRWVNDFGLASSDIAGAAWLNGGSITLYAAPRVSSANTGATVTDLSGSVLVNPGAMIDVSGGGRVDQRGKLDLTAQGGNLSLYAETSYFEITSSAQLQATPGSLSGFRVGGLLYALDSGTNTYTPVNPDRVNAHVALDPSAVRAQGFAGGGSFTLTAPDFSFGNDGATATQLPLDFISSTGFANYNITSYKTDLIANAFSNNLGGTNAVLATQTVTIVAGQTLNLSQSMLPSILSTTQGALLRGLPTGGDLFSILPAVIPENAWDRKAANLTLGGLLELHVAQGGSIVGEAGASLTVGKMLNEGTIRLPGGAITQQQVLPVLYTGTDALGVHALSDAFAVNPDGSIDEGTASLVTGLTNAQLAGSGSPDGPQHPIYLLGLLDADQGLVFAPGSVTDLSGISIRNPYATDGAAGQLIDTGRVVAGGTIQALPDAALLGQRLFQPTASSAYFALQGLAASSHNGMAITHLDVGQQGLQLIAAPGSLIDLSGASDIYDQPVAGAASGLAGSHYAPSAVWSDAGTLKVGAGATLTGASLILRGGAPQARGGTLELLDPVLSQHDPDAPAANMVSADMLAASGIDTLIADGSIDSIGDVTVNLARGFFLQDRPFVNDASVQDGASTPDGLVPAIRSHGGTLEINAPYIGFSSKFDTLSTPAIGTPGTGNVDFEAQAIDFTGVLLIDQSVGSASFGAVGDIRMTGVVPWQQTFLGNQPVASLHGQIAASGNLAFMAGQIYPTTGSTFAITSAGPIGEILFARGADQTPDAPYSAGGNLVIQAAKIIQDGVIRVPLGSLTLGGTGSYVQNGNVFAPATTVLTLGDGSITSVSANGLTIPYGTTTDQTEWYFAPTSADPLAAPPGKELSLSGTAITISAGANVDITGSGDVYAYEFVPGTGGSRDVLNQLNPDTFTSNNGYQYPDGRQVYAIVPGLSDNKSAAYDPIYSANYGSLATPGGTGLRVWLQGGNGLAAGWYTLLPAQYALLPGGMRVVEQTSAANSVQGTSQQKPDGSLVVSGRYGDALSGSAQSQWRLFEVQSQAVINKDSLIALTDGNDYFSQLASHAGNAAPRLPRDAGQLSITPSTSLVVDATLSAAADKGGRGAEVDIAGQSIDILAELPSSLPGDGIIRVTAASLSNLGADSLLVGATRTDNADGTTAINVTANHLSVANDATHPLSAGEILLAAQGDLTISDGSAVTATGTLSDQRTGAYLIGSDTVPGTGALVRVANGPERLVNRVNFARTAGLTVGAATLSGQAVMLDTSGAVDLSSGMTIANAKFVALGAPRIGFGTDPASYDGLTVTNAIMDLLTQSGAQLTVRSQSTIDFAGGTYDFGDIRFDAASLSSLGGGDVLVHGGTVGLGNTGGDARVCADCGTGDGAFQIDARAIVFTGGELTTKASVLNADTPVLISTAVTAVVPAGTQLVLPAGGGFILSAPAEITVPVGTALNLAAGTGLLAPGGAAGLLASGTTVSPEKGGSIVLAQGGSFYFPNGFTFCVGSSCNSRQPDIFTLANNTTVPVPGGTQVQLQAPAQVNLTQFFGQVGLSAANGISTQGKGAVLDVGQASLVVKTPIIMAQPSGSAVVPDLTLVSTSTVSIDGTGLTAPAAAGIAPGAAITIQGQSVSVTSAILRAPAGQVTVEATNDIVLAGGTKMDASGYVATFGDSADPTTQNAPGGKLTLQAANGSISLGDSTLSVGGGVGDAGTLSLLAPAGTIDFSAATLDGKAGPQGRGGVFILDERNALDLSDLSTRVSADGFTGGFGVHTGTGDLLVGADEIIRSGAVMLTADGGSVEIAGMIDTSGINGGDVALYGRSGVTLDASARITATASGYPDNDTRQAKGGNVTLGTDYITSTVGADGLVDGQSGRISIASGALIDVSAKRLGARLVPYNANGTQYFNYVESDQGGTVTFRAPVTGPSGAETANLAVDSTSSIAGASAINLVGFRRWDLAAVANSGQFTGVALNGNTVTLDVTAGLDTANTDGTQTVVNGINFLGDKGAGGHATLVDYVQGFDASGIYANLGGLAAQANFHAQPGIDLSYAGNITLASNWNLGAGIVDQDAAVAGIVAGKAMVFDAALGKNRVIFGQEANLLQNYTDMLYHVDGAITGEPGILTLRAGGSLKLNGSITDGFFTFRDQTDPAYLSTVGNLVSNVALTVQGGCSDNTCTGLTDWSAYTSVTAVPAKYLGLTIVPGATVKPYVYAPYGSSTQVSTPPYDAAANSAASQGGFSADANGNVAGGGDPVGSAELLPLLVQPDGSARVASAWSYNFVAGADLAETAAFLPSVNPGRIDPGAVNADFIVQGGSSYNYARTTAAQGGAIPGILNVDGAVAYQLAGVPTAANGSVTIATWLDSLLASHAAVSPTSTAVLVLPQTGAFTTLVQGYFADFVAAAGLQPITTTTDHPANGYKTFTLTTLYRMYAMPVPLLDQFITNYLVPNQALLASFFPGFTPTPPTSSGTRVTAYTKPLVRTGTGNIDIAAAGNVDLTNGVLQTRPTYLSGELGVAAQVGGTAVYTAGHPVAPITVTVQDPVSGENVTIDLGDALDAPNNLANTSGYRYGLETSGVSVPGILVANPVHAEGGGDLSVTAGKDVLGRRDIWTAQNVSVANLPSWAGSVEQPWRPGTVGSNTNAAIDPQLFTDGLATLGGGDITVSATGNISDLSVVADNSLVTASANGASFNTLALAAFGAGNVSLTAGQNMLGGRVDIASGTGRITAGHDIVSAGGIFDTSHQILDNLLRLQITDATVDVVAGGDLDFQGVASLGPVQKNNVTEQADARGLYSDQASLALLANGSITVANGDDNLLTPASFSTNGVKNIIYPGNFAAAALTGDLNLVTGNAAAGAILMRPSPDGQLQLLAAGNIAPASLAMLDADVGLLPGPFSIYLDGSTTLSLASWTFPAVLPFTPDSQRALLHKQVPTHAGDSQPVRIAAGGDIGTGDGGLILSVPKAARVSAGHDIINMMFFGQNLVASDITRITAGRDITATNRYVVPNLSQGGTGTPEPALLGNTFVLGGPGNLMLEAGRDLGPFLNSASTTSIRNDLLHPILNDETYGGGVLSVGNEWNPWLPAAGASVSILFGVAKGMNYDGLRETYLDPANLATMPEYLFQQKTVTTTSDGFTQTATVADRSKPIYGPLLVQWMQQNAADALNKAFGTIAVSYDQAYAVFAALPELNQRLFLNQIYFNELKETSDPAGPSYLQYGRGYQAVNTLFPAALGYTQNDLSGGANGANTTVATGNLDLRLAAVETTRGGDIDILGPGGRVIAGSVVRTSAQAARRTYDGGRLFDGNDDKAHAIAPWAGTINAIPAGYEGVLTQRGGSISTFTDGDFLLNQSRLFTEQGGDIIMWSSNADLNAGQGPKTSANFPPVLVKVNSDLYSELDQVGATTGAGIAALQAAPDVPPSQVYLIAPRGTVDFGDAGVRVSGDLFVAALRVANADNVQVGGHAVGIPVAATVDTAGLSAASNTAAAAASSAMAPVAQQANTDLPSIITVEVLGYGGDNDASDSDDRRRRPDR